MKSDYYVVDGYEYMKCEYADDSEWFGRECQLFSQGWENYDFKEPSTVTYRRKKGAGGSLIV